MQTAKKIKTLPYVSNSENDYSSPITSYANSSANTAAITTKFANILNHKFNILRNYPSSDLTFFTQALEILSEILGVQLNKLNFEGALKHFSQTFFAEKVYQKLISRAYQKIEQQLSSLDFEDISKTERADTIRDINEIVFWFNKRRQNVVQLKRLQNEGVEESCFLDFKVWQDEGQGSQQLLFLESAIFLKDYCQQNLHLKIFVLKDGHPVTPRENFSSWIDDSELSEEESGAVIPFALTIPITPQKSRQIISSFTNELDLNAFDLKPGSHMLQVEIQVCDDLGEVILLNSIEDIFYIPRGQKKGVKNFSPQSLGLWDRNFVTEDAIFNLAVQQNLESPEKIRVIFDAVFCDRKDEKLKLEIRFFNEYGAFVERSEIGVPEESFVFQKNYRPSAIIERFSEESIEIDSYQLDIEPEEIKLFCEVVIFGNHNKVILGKICEFDFVKPKMRDSVAAEPTQRSFLSRIFK